VRLIPELFLEQAARTPDAPAVIHASGTVSYRDLARSARRVAGALAELGVARESVVAVLLAPGPDMVAALLGIWLAGGCYLPLDPFSPDARLRQTVERSGAHLVLVDEASADRAAGFGAPMGAHRFDRAVEMGSAEYAPQRISPGQAAYVMYTSGSTGLPKGVVIEHGGIANRALWGLKALRLRREDRILQKTPLTFDAAGWEIFCPLMCGGPVTFGRPEAGRDAAELVASIRERDVTVLQVVPTMLRLLAAEPGLRDCTSLRLICSAGEPLHAELCQSVLARVDVEIWNTYGPTECSIDAFAYRFDAAQRHGALPIGRPVDNIRFMTVPAEGAESDDPVQELCLSGIGLARGYHHDPERTARSFVPSPQGPAGSRMYRTGDLVRRRPDGVLDFIGRLDAQVKVNGIRIEPGEIETTLAEHPDVVEAAVRASDGPGGTKRLAAWVVVSRAGAAASLTDYLRERLPPALVPALITEIDAIPRTGSGKTDRARLPEPAWDAPQRTAPEQPLTAEQRIVLACWRQVLGVERCGLDDDFFRLGGHSLMLTRLAALLMETSGLVVELRDLHYHSIAGQQAELLKQASQALPITPLPAGARLSVAHAQERFWILDQMNPRSREYLLPIVFRMPADIAVDTIEEALTLLVERHDILRARFTMDFAGVTAAVEPAAGIAVGLRVIDCPSGQFAEPLAELLSEGFDLSAAPLWRAALLRDGTDEQLFVLVYHHIIGDGWSSRIIESELRDTVTALSTGRTPQLADMQLGYFDAVSWTGAQVSEDLLSEQLEFWRELLTGLPALELPGARGSAAAQDTAGAAVLVELPASTTQALVALGRQSGVTPYVVFLTLWTITLARAAGQWDLGVASPHGGRGRPELHGLVGLFINTLVLRPGLSPDLGFADALAVVERACREAFARSAVPFEAVVDAVAPVRDRSRTPLYQNLFNFADDERFEHMPDVRDLDLLARAWRVSRTDLELMIWMYPDGHVGGALEYASALYGEDTAADLARRLRALADRFAAEPGIAIGAPGICGAPTSAPPASAPAVDPRVEQILGFMRELIEVADLGPDDDFMARGGSSLLAARPPWRV
jgi:amino acid adenylation domain-containing protein